MKRILLYLIAFLGTLSCFNQSNGNPRSKVFVFDMDDVFVDTNRWRTGTLVLTRGLTMIPSFAWRMATNRRFKKRVDGIFSKKHKINDPAHYNNSSYKLSQVARVYKPLRRSFDSLMKTIHQSGRSLIKDVITVIKKLKDRGYTIIAATNRDRIGFELTAQKLKFDQLYKGKPLFDAVIVGDAKDFVKETTINGKRFSRLKPNSAYEGYITHAAAYKPSKEYYAVVRHVVDQYVAKHTALFDTPSPAIVFFDDKKENVNGANASDLNITAYQVPRKNKATSIRKNIIHNLGLGI